MGIRERTSVGQSLQVSRGGILVLSFIWLVFPFLIAMLPLFLFPYKIFRDQRATLLMQEFQTPMGFLFGLWVRCMRSNSKT